MPSLLRETSILSTLDEDHPLESITERQRQLPVPLLCRVMSSHRRLGFFFVFFIGMWAWRFSQRTKAVRSRVYVRDERGM
ncbi:hypothetical protein MUK42_34494 [Musa troglodytarum]|uniref:Transmembrane protein n=1 Tax=Musa troglodytarum TaxID=320322 RepID=A0A9E7FAX8_9LILI|nr:hypothetical protein MUK42_34494 [Musa troglodytarum]